MTRQRSCGILSAVFAISEAVISFLNVVMTQVQGLDELQDLLFLRACLLHLAGAMAPS